MDPLLALTDVRRVYSTAAGDVAGVAGVTLSVASGEFIAIVGKSGSGKSTLLNLVTGIDRPTGGSVMVAGKDTGTMNEDDLARWRGRRVGVVFQFQQLMPTLRVAENVMMPMDFVGTVPRRLRRARADALLELVGMAGYADRRPGELSGGEQQRVAIARALANDPPVVAADEPTGNLDSHTADAIIGVLRDLADSGKAVVMVTHERDIAPRVDRVVEMADGRLLAGVVA